MLPILLLHRDMRSAVAVLLGIITFVLLFPAFGTSDCADNGGNVGGCTDTVQALVGVTYPASWRFVGVAVALIAGIGIGLAIWSFGGRDYASGE